MYKSSAHASFGRTARILGFCCILALLMAVPAMGQQKGQASKTAVNSRGESEPQSVTFNSSKAAPAAKSEDLSTAAPPQSEKPAPAVDPGGSMSTTIKQPADFHECVRVALVQSPLLTKSALEIESRRLDVQDAWATFIPTISLNTTYWFKQPPSTSTSTNNRPFTISFSTGSWNPFLSGFDVKAKQEMTNIAVLAHLKVISEGIKRLAQDFLRLSMVQEQRDINKKKQDVNKQNVEFFKTRASMGHATQVELRIAETRLLMAKAEEDKILSTRNMIMDDIKFILGVPFITKLDLDVAVAKEQILGKFAPADVTDEKVRRHSFELRMNEYEKNLQKKNIALSYVKMLPTFGFTFQTVDALSTEQRRLEKGVPFYPGVNFNLPLDYWTKGRETARQYKKLDQLSAGNRAKEYELMASVQKAMSEYQGFSSDLNLATAKSELGRLQDEQSEYRYKTGQLDFDKLVTDRNDYLDYRQRQALAQMQRDEALLALKHLSGDLQIQFIDVAAWEK